jgi:N6-L-threonylcarbamoyladenine synthase
MRVLGIESSCDETAFAVVDDSRRVRCNAIASQVELHARFGGVVPEIASRAHLEACVPLFHQCLAEAACTIDDIDAIAVTRGPGLAGCLLVGMEFAKGLALRHGKPLVSVHHIAGHIDSPQLALHHDAWGHRAEQDPAFEPYVALVVSGGHSSLVAVHERLRYEILGETWDDAVGEAYDKVAKLLGLGYPGGPVIDRLAEAGNPDAHHFPRPLRGRAEFDFSFSGLKTAVARVVEAAGETDRCSDSFIADIAASFQAACIDVLLDKARRALEHTGLRRLAITGGVACNRGLRAEAARRLRGVQVAIPKPQFCADNAAMIAGVGGALLAAGVTCGLGVNADPGLGLVDVPSWQAE